MFEAETQEIQKRLSATLEIYDRLEAVHSEYRNARNDQYLYFDTRIEGRHIVFTRALEALRRIVESEICVPASFNYYASDCKADDKVTAAIEKVNNISTDDVLNNFTYCLTPYRYNNKQKYQIKGDTVKLELCHRYSLRLILNTLNILINGSIETKQIYEKCKEALSKDNTFIYRDIKITCYENGNTKLVFANKQILDKMVILLGTVKEARND